MKAFPKHTLLHGDLTTDHRAIFNPRVKMQRLIQRHILLLLSLVLSTTFCNAQLTIKDFRLCLDNTLCGDSVLRISKAELLNAKTVTANFSWFNITSATVYIGSGNYTSEIITVALRNNKFNDQTAALFKRLVPGMLVTIIVDGHNAQMRKVDWSSLSIIVTE